MKHLLLALIAFVCASARADLVLPAVLSDGLVLQRQTSARLWGWDAPGHEISIKASWLDDAVIAKADAKGWWSIRIPTGQAGTGHTIAIAGSTTATLRDVAIGEVWICSGQSNMEWTLAMADDTRAINAAGDTQLRMFTVGKQLSLHPMIDCSGSWQHATPQTAPAMSAVAYHFGQKLRTELDVPVGLIVSAWGGTRIEAWMPPHSLADFDQYATELQMVALATGDPSDRTKLETLVEDQWWAALDPPFMSGWFSPDAVDSEWQTMNLPASLGSNGETGLANFDGVIYFRRDITLPAEMTGKDLTLELGPIDDEDDVWFNGTHIGRTHGANQWAATRRYTVPAEIVREGRNTIAVRVLDTGGTGGINGKPEQMALSVDGMSVPLAGDWRVRVGRNAALIPDRPAGLNPGPNTATILYAGMIEPVANMTMRGAIWYQGESNRNSADRYDRLMESLIGAWRTRTGIDDLPFYFVQIAPYAYPADTGQTARLREAQTKALRVPRTGMVVTTDVGNPRDIHPKDKRTVGHRLALIALAKDYARADVAYSGPMYRATERQGDRMIVRFDHASGLMSRAGPVRHVQIAGADKVFVAAEVKVENDTLVVWSDRVPEPVAVRLGWSPDAAINLFNGAGLPAAPFRTDDWE